MPEYVALGYGHDEPKVMIDFHRLRAMLKVNAERIEGATHLEKILIEKDRYSPAMLLTQREWNDLYLVNYRSEWDEDEYFALAESLFKKHGILKP